MSELSTAYGRLIIAEKEPLFARAAKLVAEQHASATVGARPFLCALSGGSTPQEWFRWLVASRTLSPSITATTHFTVSDERHVPLSDALSNFGNAVRHFLDPLQVPPAHRHPWPVALPPAAAAEVYRANLRKYTASGGAYDLCFLGLGYDAHTASLFPATALLREDAGELFSSQEVPDKGARLTITPTGLAACGLIVVMALGSAKATALRRVFSDPHDPLSTPAQILKPCADRVIWLVDAAAAEHLG